MWPDARPQARKNRRRIHWNTLRIFPGRERRRWSQIVRRSRAVNVGQAPNTGHSKEAAMIDTSCFQAVRPPIFRSPPSRFLQEQRHQCGAGFRLLLHTHDLIARSTGISLKREKVPDTVSATPNHGDSELVEVNQA